jgi:uncharacterized protein YdaU (DUF1376 family)
VLQASSSAFAQISPFMSYNVLEMASSLDNLSDRAYVAFRKLQDKAYLKGGSLPDDDALLARMVRMTPAVFRKAKGEFLRMCGELVAVANGTITFLRAASEIAFRIQKSSKASASAQARWSANPLKNNKRGDANAYANGEDSQCSNPNPNKESKDSCGGKPPRWGFPDLDEALSETTSSTSSSPEPEAAKPSPKPKPERARAKPDGAAKSPAGYTEEFERAWKAMPLMARKRGSKPEAFKLWSKLSQEDRENAFTGIGLWEDNQYAMAAERWLKRQQWVSLLEAQREKPKQREREWEPSMY